MGVLSPSGEGGLGRAADHRYAWVVHHHLAHVGHLRLKVVVPHVPNVRRAVLLRLERLTHGRVGEHGGGECGVQVTLSPFPRSPSPTRPRSHCDASKSPASVRRRCACSRHVRKCTSGAPRPAGSSRERSVECVDVKPSKQVKLSVQSISRKLVCKHARQEAHNRLAQIAQFYTILENADT